MMIGQLAWEKIDLIRALNHLAAMLSRVCAFHEKAGSKVKQDQH